MEIETFHVILSVVAMLVSLFGITLAIKALKTKPIQEVIELDCDKGVHHFDAIFNKSESEPALIKTNQFTSGEIIRLLNASKARTSTYVHSVCRYCGTIKKEGDV